MTAKWEVIEVGDQGLAAYVGAPEGDGPHPGVVVIQHAAGVDAVIQDTVRRLADAGFAAIAPDMFAHQGVNIGLSHEARQGRMRDAIAIADVNAAVSYLREHCDTAGQGIGIMGYCLGGRVTYMMAAVNPEFSAAADFYGGNALRPWGDGPSPFERTADISCPVLGLFGREDPNPSPEDVARFDAELTRLGKPHEFHVYDGTGHTFMSFDGRGYREEVAREAWERAIAWFQKYLVKERTAA